MPGYKGGKSFEPEPAEATAVADELVSGEPLVAPDETSD